MNNGWALRKCISLDGPGWISDPNYINSYLYDQGGTQVNRIYIRDQSGTKWIKIWIHWKALQPTRPASRSASWNDLSNNQKAALDRLDAQIHAANVDGIQVILGLFDAYPSWTNGSSNQAILPPSGDVVQNRVSSRVVGEEPPR